MSRDVRNQPVKIKSGHDFLADNPLYSYLLDLQQKRIKLVEALAPRRHIAWQLRVLVVFLVLWLISLQLPQFSGISLFLLMILGPIAILTGTVYAGWHAQMVAVSNYPSPLDSPRALELLLSTPLTEKEITDATVFAYARFPFFGFSTTRMLMVVLNLGVLGIIIWTAGLRGALEWDIFLMTMDFYLPACCVFIYSPVLTALDILYVPRSWLWKRSVDTTPESEVMSGHSGRMLIIVGIAAILPVILKVYEFGLDRISTTMWVALVGCPITLISVGVISLCFYLLAPKYIEKIRRS